MLSTVRCTVLFAVFALAPIAAQVPTAESLILWDIFDSRATNDQLTARRAELQRESDIQRNVLGNPTFAGQIDAINANLGVLATPGTPLPPGSAPELHIAGFYEPLGGTNGPINIDIQRINTPMVLYCQSYETGTWTITAAPGVILTQIIIETYDPVTSVVSPPGVPVTLLDRTNGGNYDGYGGPSSTLVERIRLIASGALRSGLIAKTITGDYSAPATLTIGEADAEWRAQFVKSEATFASQSLCVATTGALFSNYAPLGYFALLPTTIFNFGGTTKLALANPTDRGALLIPSLPNSIKAYAVSPRGNVYVRANGGVSTLNLTTFALTPVAGAPSNVTGLSYDQVADRLVVSDDAGAGALSLYNEVSATWSTLTSLGGQDVTAVVWHAADGATYTVGRGGFFGGPIELRQLNSAGVVAQSFTLALDSWDEFFGLDKMQAYSVGPYIQIIGPPLDIQTIGLSVRLAFLVDPMNGNILCATAYFD